MKGMSGFELLDRVRELRPLVPVILITGAAHVSDAVDAIKRGAYQYLAKPCDGEQLRATVVRAIRLRLADAPAVTRPSRSPGAVQDEELIGDGPAMRSLQTAIGRVAQSSAPVLITGETGVGKELVARSIHARGDRRSRPFSP